MPSRDPRAYAASPKGKAARAKARARFIAKSRELNAKPPAVEIALLTACLSTWSQPCRN
jgi:hypothetical protein